jgi:hypothetical protein
MRKFARSLRGRLQGDYAEGCKEITRKIARRLRGRLQGDYAEGCKEITRKVARRLRGRLQGDYAGGCKEITRKVARRLRGRLQGDYAEGYKETEPCSGNGSGGITSESPSMQRAFVICHSSSLFCSILTAGAINISEIIVSNDKIIWCQSENTIT